jgi:hypothetical protein
MTIDLSELPLLRQSERSAFKRCNWAWYQEYVKGYRPIVENKTAAEFGTLIHIALATYYIPGVKRGPHPADTFADLARDTVANVKTVNYTDDETVAKWEDFSVLGVELMEEYVEHYRGDPHWHVLDAERCFDVVIPDVRHKPLVSEKGRRGFRPIVVLVGTFDLCVRDLNDNLIKMIDHKTASSFQTHHLNLDEQASTYMAVGTTALRHQGLIGPKETLSGMEYNFIKKSKIYKEPLKDDLLDALADYYADNGILHQAPSGLFADTKSGTKWLKEDLAHHASKFGLTVHGEKNESPFMRHYVPRTNAERQRQIVRISEEARVMGMVRTGELPLLKTPQRDCYWCKFFDLCELDESGLDTDYFIETTMKKFDPYADHRPGAKNSKKLADDV